MAGVLLLGAAWQSAIWKTNAKTDQADVKTVHRQPTTIDRADQSNSQSFLESRIVELKDIMSNPSQRLNHNHLVVDLSDRRVYVYQNNRLQVSYPVAVGKPNWETPIGVFWVKRMQIDPGWRHPITREKIAAGPKNPLGARWIGFWSDGHSEIGFHGTNQGDSIGKAISHGCLRLHNSDIVALYQQVRKGTLVRVQP